MLKEHKAFILRILEGYKKALGEKYQTYVNRGFNEDSRDTAFEMQYCQEVQDELLK